MTPQEKALELVEGMYSATQEEGIYGDWYIAKKCALIAVDEILNNFPDEFWPNYSIDNTSYWKEVKQEIQNL